ncbi:MAG: GNAT family N-acetyltransferase [Thermomicrobiales bacterium]
MRPFGSSSPADESEELVIAPARLPDLWPVGRIQRRAFKPRLAYGFGTLLMLWMLPGVQFLVARRAGTVVGCVLGDRHQGQARVVNLAVDPILRRHGIGRALLAALESAIPEGNAVLMVEQENAAARALYTASGYAEVRQAWDYYGRGRHGVWMEKRRTGEPSPVVRV